MATSIGQRISMLRKRDGYTQEQLANKVGVTAQAVSKWETGQACPDISIIPELARLFGVSTDILLGNEPMPDVNKDSNEDFEEGDVDSMANKNKKHSYSIYLNDIAFPIAIIIMGICLFCNIFFDIAAPFWKIFVASGVIFIGLSMLFSHVTPLSLGVTLSGALWMMQIMGLIIIDSIWKYILPALVILWGITLLFDKIIRKKRHSLNKFNFSSNEDSTCKYSCDDDYINCNVKFAEQNISASNSMLRGGNLEVAFGELKLNLTGCTAITSGAVMNVNVTFGSATLILPQSIRLDISPSKSFGDISVHGSPASDAKYVLSLNAKVRFGDLEIIYQ